MRNETPPWPAHDDDGVWYCDAHGSYDCRHCAASLLDASNQPEGHLFDDRDGDGLCDYVTSFHIHNPAIEKRCLNGRAAHTLTKPEGT